MQSPGRRWLQDYYLLFKQTLNSINFSYIGLLLVVISPALLISLIGSHWLNLVGYIISFYLIYFAFNDQDKLFELTRSESYWLVLMPFYWIFLGWYFLILSMSGFQTSISLISSVFFLLLVSFLPLYRRNKNWDKKTTRFTYKQKYYFVAALGVMQHLYMIWSS